MVYQIQLSPVATCFRSHQYGFCLSHITGRSTSQFWTQKKFPSTLKARCHPGKRHCNYNTFQRFICCPTANTLVLFITLLGENHSSLDTDLATSGMAISAEPPPGSTALVLGLWKPFSRMRRIKKGMKQLPRTFFLDSGLRRRRWRRAGAKQAEAGLKTWIPILGAHRRHAALVICTNLTNGQSSNWFSISGFLQQTTPSRRRIHGSRFKFMHGAGWPIECLAETEAQRVASWICEFGDISKYNNLRKAFEL